MSLTILCVTRAEPYAEPFLSDLRAAATRLHAEFVVGADGQDAVEKLKGADAHVVPLRSKGYIESVLDEAIAACTGEYILRLDDDERISSCMLYWLEKLQYQEAPHWKFPRVHLWGDRARFIVNPPLWPDHQTRLSLKQYSGGRRMVHAGSPHGGGALAPVVIEHHKFLVKSYDERAAIAARYDKVQMGFGTGGMTPFNLPEVTWGPSQMQLEPVSRADYLAAEDAARVPA